MTVTENVVQKLAELLPGSQLEVLDFVEFLAQKSRGNPEESRASQGEEPPPNGDALRVSGKNLEVILDKLKR